MRGWLGLGENRRRCGSGHPAGPEGVTADIDIANALGKSEVNNPTRQAVMPKLSCKSPSHVWLVDELPKGPTGKTPRREIVPSQAQPRPRASQRKPS
jgi:acyl-coenzyme A synthetase/AMP-(fatty) acid ligase